MKRLVAHAAVLVVGLFALAWVFTLGAHPQIACRGVVMGPGDVCVNADGGREQTYEERLAAAQNARPVVGVVGAGVAAFGLALMLHERRRVVANLSETDSLRKADSSARTQGGPHPTASPR